MKWNKILISLIVLISLTYSTGFCEIYSKIDRFNGEKTIYSRFDHIYMSTEYGLSPKVDIVFHKVELNLKKDYVLKLTVLDGMRHNHYEKKNAYIKVDGVIFDLPYEDMMIDHHIANICYSQVVYKVPSEVIDAIKDGSSLTVRSFLNLQKLTWDVPEPVFNEWKQVILK